MSTALAEQAEPAPKGKLSPFVNPKNYLLSMRSKITGKSSSPQSGEGFAYRNEPNTLVPKTPVVSANETEDLEASLALEAGVGANGLVQLT